jgi:hypothetical protein
MRRTLYDAYLAALQTRAVSDDEIDTVHSPQHRERIDALETMSPEQSVAAALLWLQPLCIGSSGFPPCARRPPTLKHNCLLRPLPLKRNCLAAERATKMFKCESYRV